jgi:hypothetical protein
MIVQGRRIAIDRGRYRYRVANLVIGNTVQARSDTLGAGVR